MIAVWLMGGVTVAWLLLGFLWLRVEATAVDRVLSERQADVSHLRLRVKETRPGTLEG